MKKLILVRHVVTDDNELAKLSGHIDSKVSKQGKIQIDKITDYLKNEKIDKIYTTTSSRTKETVKYLAERNKIDIQESEALKAILGISKEKTSMKYKKITLMNLIK